MNILMVLSSHAKLGDTGRKTGFWLEELAAPYYVFKDAGAMVTLASPVGDRPPMDPKSDEPAAQTQFAASKPVAAVCHAPGVLRNAKAPDGSSVVHGRQVAGYTNSEEEAVGLTDVVPFLVEDMLKDQGGVYSKVADWQPHVVIDGLLVTGQNPASSAPAARALLKLLARH